MGFGAPASEKLTQKTNAKNKAQSAQNQRKISAQKFSIKQGADIKCVKKDLLPEQKFGGGLFYCKIYRSASSTAFLRFLSIQSDAMSEIASDFDFSLTDFMILLFKECSVFAG